MERRWQNCADFSAAIANASLAQTIRKLRTGLVNIISSFLSCDRKDARLDYHFLTSLSDTSRQEAIDALSQLSYRMSRSALSLHAHPAPQGKVHRDHHDRTRYESKPDRDSKETKEKKKGASRDKDKMKPEIRRVQLSNASTSTLAIVRPRTRRTGSSTSSRSGGSQGTPPPAYSNPSSPSPQASPTLQPPRQQQARQSSQQPSAASPYPHAEPVYRRRQDKTTPSMYTFASDSTKLGEIPMRKWNQPYDYDAMAKKNCEVPLRPWTSEEPTQKPKKGFFGMFRKTAAAA